MIKHLPILLSLACCAAPTALAGPHCGQQTTRGHWAYSCEGEIGGVPTRQLGTCNASASGFWQCSGWVNLGGTILAHALRGQAYDNPDCTGTISYENTLNGLPAGTLDIVYRDLRQRQRGQGPADEPRQRGRMLAQPHRHSDLRRPMRLALGADRVSLNRELS